MKRVKPRALKEYPWIIQKLFGFQRKKYGRELESAKIWARSSWVFLGLSTFYAAITRKSSPIDSKLRGLIIVLISQENQCSFCINLNSDQLIKAGVNLDKVQALSQFSQSPLFSEKEKATLTYAQAAIRFDVTDETVTHLRTFYSEDEIVELTAIISFQQCSTTFNTALNIT